MRLVKAFGVSIHVHVRATTKCSNNTAPLEKPQNNLVDTNAGYCTINLIQAVELQNVLNRPLNS